MKLRELSKTYEVKKIKEEDLEEVLCLCLNNPIFYKYCPPFPTLETLKEDMYKLPPNKTYKDKFYIGFFENKQLIAVMDLILSFPTLETAFFGFFMVKKEMQGKGIGSLIIQEVFAYLSQNFNKVRLGYVLGNPQSEAFWLKQKFVKTGVIAKEELYSIVVLEKELGGQADGN